jgi:hypothetical protein
MSDRDLRKCKGPARFVDVARVAGVHPSTASRVINKAGQISVPQETRARILEAATGLRIGEMPWRLLAEDSEDSIALSADERLVGEDRIDGILVASARPDSPRSPSSGSLWPRTYYLAT